MAKTFTKIGKEITIAVKQGGPDVVGNSRLRALMAEARSENMPKDNVEKAIKRALEKNQGDFKEVVFEGYGPHGIAYLVETATDNNTRTVANVRSYFTKCGGSLGTSGSVSFMFDHKCVFRIKYQEGMDLDELQLALCECDDDPEVFIEEQEDKDENITKNVVIYGAYESYGAIQKYIEDNGYELVSGGFERIPNVELKDVTPEQIAEIYDECCLLYGMEGQTEKQLRSDIETALQLFRRVYLNLYMGGGGRYPEDTQLTKDFRKRLVPEFRDTDKYPGLVVLADNTDLDVG